MAHSRFTKSGGVTKRRLQFLEDQLRRESPVLASVLKSFRTLDRVAHKTGLLETDASHAARISWWPMIAVLGTYSAGKSSFINWYLGQKVQRTGNQAVDDKFTVICATARRTAGPRPCQGSRWTPTRASRSTA